MKAFRFGCAVLFVVAFVSCSVQTSWEMVGKWQSPDGKETIEFSRDGTMAVVNGPTSIKTTFKMSDPKRMEVSLASLGTAVLQIAVDKGTLSLTDEKGKVRTYQKAKPAEAKQAEAKQPEAKQPAAQKQPAPHGK